MVKRADHAAFGLIYTQKARSALGLGKVKWALQKIAAALIILKCNKYYLWQNSDLASAYLVQGDILAAQNNLAAATESYRQAQATYSALLCTKKQQKCCPY